MASRPRGRKQRRGEFHDYNYDLFATHTSSSPVYGRARPLLVRPALADAQASGFCFLPSLTTMSAKHLPHLDGSDALSTKNKRVEDLLLPTIHQPQSGLVAAAPFVAQNTRQMAKQLAEFASIPSATSSARNGFYQDPQVKLSTIKPFSSLSSSDDAPATSTLTSRSYLERPRTFSSSPSMASLHSASTSNLNHRLSVSPYSQRLVNSGQHSVAPASNTHHGQTSPRSTSRHRSPVVKEARGQEQCQEGRTPDEQVGGNERIVREDDGEAKGNKGRNTLDGSLPQRSATVAGVNVASKLKARRKEVNELIQLVEAKWKEVQALEEANQPRPPQHQKIPTSPTGLTWPTYQERLRKQEKERLAEAMKREVMFREKMESATTRAQTYVEGRKKSTRLQLMKRLKRHERIIQQTEEEKKRALEAKQREHEERELAAEQRRQALQEERKKEHRDKAEQEERNLQRAITRRQQIEEELLEQIEAHNARVMALQRAAEERSGHHRASARGRPVAESDANVKAARERYQVLMNEREQRLREALGLRDEGEHQSGVALTAQMHAELARKRDKEREAARQRRQRHELEDLDLRKIRLMQELDVLAKAAKAFAKGSAESNSNTVDAATSHEKSSSTGDQRTRSKSPCSVRTGSRDDTKKNRDDHQVNVHNNPVRAPSPSKSPTRAPSPTKHTNDKPVKASHGDASKTAQSMTAGGSVGSIDTDSIMQSTNDGKHSSIKRSSSFTSTATAPPKTDTDSKTSASSTTALVPPRTTTTRNRSSTASKQNTSNGGQSIARPPSERTSKVSTSEQNLKSGTNNSAVTSPPSANSSVSTKSNTSSTKVVSATHKTKENDTGKPDPKSRGQTLKHKQSASGVTKDTITNKEKQGGDIPKSTSQTHKVTDASKNKGTTAKVVDIKGDSLKAKTKENMIHTSEKIATASTSSESGPTLVSLSTSSTEQASPANKMSDGDDAKVTSNISATSDPKETSPSETATTSPPPKHIDDSIGLDYDDPFADDAEDPPSESATTQVVTSPQSANPPDEGATQTSKHEQGSLTNQGENEPFLPLSNNEAAEDVQLPISSATTPPNATPSDDGSIVLPTISPTSPSPTSSSPISRIEPLSPGKAATSPSTKTTPSTVSPVTLPSPIAPTLNSDMSEKDTSSNSVTSTNGSSEKSVPTPTVVTKASTSNLPEDDYALDFDF